ncbi:zinc-dependent metalloprotease [Balneolales bacterium ANBcel1]|nr:zinc-dependent metalloprotease [Balneolales bacterium ANBcel1]
MLISRIVPLLVSILLLSSCSLFRTTAENDTGDIPEGTIEVGEPGPVADDDDPYADYNEIITDEAVSDKGMFGVHQVDDKLYFDIPDTLLGREILLVTRIVRAQEGTGYGGMRLSNRVIRWDKRGGDILLRSVMHQSVADTASAVYNAVRAATFEPIIASFEIEGTGPDSTSLIEVTRLFTNDVPEFNPRERYRGRRVDSERSYVDRARAFPENVEVSNVLTMQADNVPGGGDLRTISLMLNHSFLRLPDEPMQPRLFDERVGFFSVQMVDYSRPEHQAQQRRYITRWRLEKKDPEAELSEPVKPIVFYVDPGTPEFLVDYVVQGVNDWQPAFEQAGFKNAIIGKRAPVDDPDFSMEDARYSMVRWMPSTTMNAYGPHVNDPRSGEIITSSIGMFHNVQRLLRNWYFVQGGAVDERMRNLPMPDSLMGRLVQMVVAHEVGHTLGFPHNMKASATVPTDSLRSPTFTRKYGTTPSIMDYARMNYVAQPGDGAYMFPIVSIYDKFAVEWGYKPIPEAANADEERPFLNEIARRQEEEPMLLFGSLSTVDPTQQREALGDNHVASTRYGIANLKRIMEFIVDAAGQDGDDFSTLQELYNSVHQQRDFMLGHVVNWVGGVYGERKVYGQDGAVYEPVPRDRQVEALNYLLEEAFATPDYLLDPSVLDLIQASGAVNRVMQSQRRLLQMLMSSSRLIRMAELEAGRDPDSVYPVDEMMTDLRTGIWMELSDNSVSVDLYRRNLQRTYLEVVEMQVGGSFFRSSGEAASMIRGHLRDLREEVGQAVPRAADNVTRYHLQDVEDHIKKILDAD